MRLIISTIVERMGASDLQFDPYQLTVGFEFRLLSDSKIVTDQDEDATTAHCLGFTFSAEGHIARGNTSLLQISGDNQDSVPTIISGFSASTRQWNSSTLFTTDLKLIFRTFNLPGFCFLWNFWESFLQV